MKQKLSPADRILVELVEGTELARVQAYPWAPVKHLLGDKTVAEGTVAKLTSTGLVTPIDKVEVGAPKIRFALTDKGRQRAALFTSKAVA